jgi:hypothetical protein
MDTTDPTTVGATAMRAASPDWVFDRTGDEKVNP